MSAPPASIDRSCSRTPASDSSRPSRSVPGRDERGLRPALPRRVALREREHQRGDAGEQDPGERRAVEAVRPTRRELGRGRERCCAAGSGRARLVREPAVTGLDGLAAWPGRRRRPEP